LTAAQFDALFKTEMIASGIWLLAAGHKVFVARVAEPLSLPNCKAILGIGNAIHAPPIPVIASRT